MRFQYDDGGRKAAGFKGHADDCVTRAICITAELNYRTIYDELYRQARDWAERQMDRPRARAIFAESDGRNEVAIRKEVRRRTSPRLGVSPDVYKPYIAALGFQWAPTMQIGSGCRVHLRADELPPGRLIVRCSKHIVAVIDGAVHDTGDPCRGGARCVYGYWSNDGGRA